MKGNATFCDHLLKYLKHMYPYYLKFVKNYKDIPVSL